MFNSHTHSTVLLPMIYLEDVMFATLSEGVNLDSRIDQNEERNEPLAGNGWILKPTNP